MSFCGTLRAPLLEHCLVGSLAHLALPPVHSLLAWERL